MMNFRTLGGPFRRHSTAPPRFLLSPPLYIVHNLFFINHSSFHYIHSTYFQRFHFYIQTCQRLQYLYLLRRGRAYFGSRQHHFFRFTNRNSPTSYPHDVQTALPPTSSLPEMPYHRFQFRHHTRARSELGCRQCREFTHTLRSKSKHFHSPTSTPPSPASFHGWTSTPIHHHIQSSSFHA